MGTCCRDERGQVAPLLALLALAVGFACFGLGRLGAAAVERATVRTAADAAALAGAAGGAGEARRLARVNGGEVVELEAAGTDTRVRVRAGSAPVTSARARSVRPPDVTGTSDDGELAPALRAALARAEIVLGIRIPVTSGYRSAAQQARLYEQRMWNPYPVTPPGSSMHERGLAVDVAPAFAPRLAAVAHQTGLCQPYPRADPVHFELCRPSAGRPAAPG